MFNGRDCRVDEQGVPQDLTPIENALIYLLIGIKMD
jgi:hypothetical protein